MLARDVPDCFHVAFSFAGGQRKLVRDIATALEHRLGRGTVFFDEWFESYIAGLGADLRLQDIYLRKAALVVSCVSQQYNDKPWTLIEHEAIRALRMELLGTLGQNAQMRILPLRVADGQVEGILFNTIAPDVRDRPVEQTVDLICNRLRTVRPELVTEVASGQPQVVYLAEPTADLEESCGRLRLYLQELGWVVLPESPYDSEGYEEQLTRDLKRSLAFVQLLGPFPWRRGEFDKLQARKAQELSLKRFLHRNPDLDLKTVADDSHRALLQEVDVLAMGFEDLKVYLKQELTLLARQSKASATPNDVSQVPPLVRVMVRSPNPDVLWEKVFELFFNNGSILAYKLRDDETFEEKHREGTCQGFLVVCDEAGMRDGPYSPRDDIDSCRTIQLREKAPAARPPVALAYWPPPAPSWPLLLRAQALNFHRILGPQASDWDKFFEAVRALGS
jgi:hypothetical protein